MEYEKLKKHEVFDGVRVIPLYCDDKIMITIFEIDTEVKAHKHESLQFGLVLDGESRFRIGEEIKNIGKGVFFYVPSNVEHEVKATKKPFRVLIVFIPPRKEYLHLFK